MIQFDFRERLGFEAGGRFFRVMSREYKTVEAAKTSPRKNQPESIGLSATLTIPELEQSKAAVLNTLASRHSRRSYEYAIERLPPGIDPNPD